MQQTQLARTHNKQMKQINIRDYESIVWKTKSDPYLSSSKFNHRINFLLLRLLIIILRKIFS